MHIRVRRKKNAMRNISWYKSICRCRRKRSAYPIGGSGSDVADGRMHDRRDVAVWLPLWLILNLEFARQRTDYRSQSRLSSPGFIYAEMG